MINRKRLNGVTLRGTAQQHSKDDLLLKNVQALIDCIKIIEKRLEKIDDKLNELEDRIEEIEAEK